MIKQDITDNYENDRPDSKKIADEMQEIAEWTIRLKKIQSLLQDYPNEDTQAGNLIMDEYIKIEDIVSGLLNYIDHSDERSKCLEEMIDDACTIAETQAEWDRQDEDYHIAMVQR